MPESLKARIEQAAERRRPLGQRLAGASGRRRDPSEASGVLRRDRRAPHGAQRYTGWAALIPTQGGTTCRPSIPPTPSPSTVELGVGDIRIEASDRTETVVEVRPSDPAQEGRRDRRRADARRVRGRPPAGQGPERLAAVDAAPGRRVDRRRDRTPRRVRSVRVETGVAALHGRGSDRRVPLQGRCGRRPARRVGPGGHQDRRRRHHVGTGRRQGTRSSPVPAA